MGEVGSLCPERIFASGWGHLEASLSPTETKFYSVPHYMTMSCSVSESHRVIGCFESGRTLKDHLSATPCHGLGHLSVDQVVQIPI